jgi:hypothetical protein
MPMTIMKCAVERGPSRYTAVWPDAVAVQVGQRLYLWIAKRRLVANGKSRVVKPAKTEG